MFCFVPVISFDGGTAVVCLLKQSGHCIWIKTLRCFPASSTVTQTSAMQIRNETLKWLYSISNDDCTGTAYMHRFILKGEGCVLFSRGYAFHTVTDRHIMNPNTHGRECAWFVCVWLCGCMRTCTKTNINLSCNDTLSSYGRFCSPLPFFFSFELNYSSIMYSNNRKSTV